MELSISFTRQSPEGLKETSWVTGADAKYTQDSI